MTYAFNGISAIEYENNKTISKLSTDPAPLLIEINTLPSTVAYDSVNPEVRRIMTKPSIPLLEQHPSTTVPTINYQYEFKPSHKTYQY